MIYKKTISQSALRQKITKSYRADENECVNHLLDYAEMPNGVSKNIHDRAKDLVKKVRAEKLGKAGLDSFLYAYDLTSEEGIALMCLAEALLRIPDKETVDRLIRDKITSADWKAQLGKTGSLFVNATTWGLMLTGKVLSQPETEKQNKKLSGALKKLIERSGEPVIRTAVTQAMKILGRQFVMGRNISEALERAKESEEKGFRYSYDMLGEAARTAEHAKDYFKAYQDAIHAVGKASAGKGVIHGPGISVKLSALHPRYEFSKHEKILAEVVPRLKTLALLAKDENIGLTIDAEEADRLDLSLDIIEAVFCDKELDGWDGFGLALQSYQKRTFYLIDWLEELTKKTGRKLMLRLIKGAYWDSEIKFSQENGLDGYPVFTRKASTDVSFLACAKKILSMPDAFYPQFATHNAYSVAAILELAGDRGDYEFQCLHGMGRALYSHIVGPKKLNRPCRIYAPVGGHEDLLAYLVRRLLENGANTSFVNRIVDEKAPIEELIMNPIDLLRRIEDKPHPKIPLPKEIYGKSRKNSSGIDLSNINELNTLKMHLDAFAKKEWRAEPLLGEEIKLDKKNAHPVTDPTHTKTIVGKVFQTTEKQMDIALGCASEAAFSWDAKPARARAKLLERAGDIFEARIHDFIALAVREGGKTLPDAVSEIREGIDFCRYYARLAKKDLATPAKLPGYTGEYNHLELHGRGPMVCISPWNFPFAIFLGQVAAALVAGNPVLAKPADQTPLIAFEAIRVLHEAGIPRDVLQFTPARGSFIGKHVIPDERICGVLFTGSTEVAHTINKTLANRAGPIVPFIAETGGQNSMIVDSSALLEQVVVDVMTSAFGSAGQRCSALRVLYVQEDIADEFLHMLKGAMAELSVGDPSLLATDIGPAIDETSKGELHAHKKLMREKGKLIFEVPLSKSAGEGSFVAPAAYEIKKLSVLKSENFGPILHVIRFKMSKLDEVIQDINNTGYGLTLGIHSRIDQTVHYIQERMHVGNTYVNRNMIGAVVGVQPFGGEGLSGTGPKAGGPNYLRRLCTERTLCINTVAAGGNATLLSLEEN